MMMLIWFLKAIVRRSTVTRRTAATSTALQGAVAVHLRKEVEATGSRSVTLTRAVKGFVTSHGNKGAKMNKTQRKVWRLK